MRKINLKLFEHLVPPGIDKTYYLNYAWNTYFANQSKEAVDDQRLANDFVKFLNKARMKGLNIADNELYAVYQKERNDGIIKKMMLATSIDCLRRLAAKNQYYGGQGEYEEERDEDNKLIAVAVNIYKINPVSGEVITSRSRARFAEFNRPYSPTWKRMPSHMLGKCAEAHGLRRVYPEQIGQLYEVDEIHEESPAPTKLAANAKAKQAIKKAAKEATK